MVTDHWYKTVFLSVIRYAKNKNLDKGKSD